MTTRTRILIAVLVTAALAAALTSRTHAAESPTSSQSTITFDLGDGVTHALRFQSAHAAGQTVVLSGVTAPPVLQKWVTGLDVTWEVAEYFAGVRTVVARYSLENALPTKWTQPELAASKNEISIETLELTYESIRPS